MPGRQEDRDNRAASDEENARAMWVIRNVTLQTMGVEEPVHIAYNATEDVSAEEVARIRKRHTRRRGSAVHHLPLPLHRQHCPPDHRCP